MSAPAGFFCGECKARIPVSPEQNLEDRVASHQAVHAMFDRRNAEHTTHQLLMQLELEPDRDITTVPASEAFI